MEDRVDGELGLRRIAAVSAAPGYVDGGGADRGGVGERDVVVGPLDKRRAVEGVRHGHRRQRLGDGIVYDFVDVEGDRKPVEGLADDHGAAAAGAVHHVDVVRAAAAAAAEPVDAALRLVQVASVGKCKRLARGDGEIERPVAAAADTAVQQGCRIVPTAAASAAGVVDFLAGDVGNLAGAACPAAGVLIDSVGINSRTASAAAAGKGVSNRGIAARIALARRPRAASAFVYRATAGATGFAVFGGIPRTAAAADGREKHLFAKDDGRVAAVLAAAADGPTARADGNRVGAGRKLDVVGVDHAARAATAAAVGSARAATTDQEQTRIDRLRKRDGAGGKEGVENVAAGDEGLRVVRRSEERRHLKRILRREGDGRGSRVDASRKRPGPVCKAEARVRSGRHGDRRIAAVPGRARRQNRAETGGGNRAGDRLGPLPFEPAVGGGRRVRVGEAGVGAAGNDIVVRIVELPAGAGV